MTLDSTATTSDASHHPSALELTPAQIARRVTLPLHKIHEITRQELSCAVNDLLAGGIAGSAGIVVGHPFDSIKVRMQMASNSAGRNMRSTAAMLATGSPYGGVTTLFRGIGAPFATAAVVNASIFTTYGESGRLWDTYFESSSCAISKKLVCGSLAGFVSSIIICPSEHVKVRLQTQRNGGENVMYRNSWDAAKRILASHGMVGLYRGFASTCLRQSPAFAAYFGVYDPLKEQGQARLFGKDHLWMASILAGGIAGSLSWAVFYPIDLIKSRIQALPLNATRGERSLKNIPVKIVQQQGWASLYRGLGITIFRAFPVNAIIFPTYEVASAMLNDRTGR